MSQKNDDDSSRDVWKLKWDILFNSSPESIMILSEDQTILDVNETTLKLLGKAKEDVLGQKCYKVLHNMDKPPDDCPFLEMKRNNWKISMNEMETVIGDFLITVVPMDMPGEERKVLHYARDVTLINQLAVKLIDSLQRSAAVLSVLLKLEDLMVKERDLSVLLQEFTSTICEFGDFEASWILLREGSNIKTVAKHCAKWNFEEKYGGNVDFYEIKTGIISLYGKRFFFLPLRVEDEFIGVLILKVNRIELKDEDIKLFELLADNLAITIKERRLEEGRLVAYKELDKNIESFAMLVDGIRNPLAVILGIAETMVEEENAKKRIIEEVEKIEKITSIIDERWRKSEHLRKFLKEM
ncbi:diguanylate cyclase [Euryarchaeota archaeon ex4484_178]|nr:MAG: diguanylate cyclase [Euryarchaeota archaeon ex4484_178]